MSVKTVSGARATTATLNGEVLAVDFEHHYMYYAIRNDGASNIYVSTTNKDAPAGENDVVCVPSGSSYVHYNGYGENSEIYLSGKGSATIIAQDNGENPFRNAPEGGGGGGISASINGVAVSGDLSWEDLGIHIVTDNEVKEIIKEAKGLN